VANVEPLWKYLSLPVRTAGRVSDRECAGSEIQHDLETIQKNPVLNVFRRKKDLLKGKCGTCGFKDLCGEDAGSGCTHIYGISGLKILLFVGNFATIFCGVAGY